MVLQYDGNINRCHGLKIYTFLVYIYLHSIHPPLGIRQWRAWEFPFFVCLWVPCFSKFRRKNSKFCYAECSWGSLISLFFRLVFVEVIINHYLSNLLVTIMLCSCQAVVRQSSCSRQAVVRQSSGIRQAFVRHSSGIRQAVVRQSSGSHQAVVRKLSGSRQAFFR